MADQQEQAASPTDLPISPDFPEGTAGEKQRMVKMTSRNDGRVLLARVWIKEEDGMKLAGRKWQRPDGSIRVSYSVPSETIASTTLYIEKIKQDPAGGATG